MKSRVTVNPLLGFSQNNKSGVLDTKIDENGIYGHLAVNPVFVSGWVGVDAVKHHFKLIGEKKLTKTGFVASSGGWGPPIIFQIIDYSLLPSSLVTRDKRI